MSEPNEDVHFEIDKKYYAAYSFLDERLKKLGPLLSNPTSIGIISVLWKNGELTASGIREHSVSESKPSLAGLSYHLDKMVEIDLLQVTEKRQRKKGPTLKHYTMSPGILIVPPEHIEKANKSKTLRNVFKSVFRISGTGIVALFSYLIMKKSDIVKGDEIIRDAEYEEIVLEPVIFPFIIIIVGLIIEIVLIKKEKNRILP